MTASLIDRFAPQADATLAETAIVAAPRAVTFDAAYHLDLGDVLRGSLVLRSLAALRGVPDVVGRRLGRLAAQAPAHVPVHVPAHDAVAFDRYLVELAARPGEEVVRGLVVRFSGATAALERVAPEEFVALRDAGRVRVVLSFAVRPFGEGSSLLTVEARAVTSDEASRRAFARRWRLVRAPARHLVRRILEAVKAEAETRPEARQGARYG